MSEVAYIVVGEQPADGLVVVEEIITGATRKPLFGYYLDSAAPGLAPVKVEAARDPFDHDGDGKPGGSRPRARKAAD